MACISDLISTARQTHISLATQRRPKPGIDERPAVLVTALIYQQNGRLTRPIEHYIQSLSGLANSCEHLVLFLDHNISPPDLPSHVEIHRLSIGDLQTAVRYKKYADHVRLPGQRSENKDTLDYLILVNAKTELIERALRMHPDVTRAAWVDCGIAHILSDPQTAMSDLANLHSLPEGLTIPGIEPQPTRPGDGICWRFCGGVVAGDRRSLLRLHQLHQQAMDDLWPRLTWEVNVWARLEMQGCIGPGSEVPLRWYAADHNDSMLQWPIMADPPDDSKGTAPRVALNMIVRNEATIIERALTSVLGHVHACIICDTGSTDDTVSRIQDFCERHGLACEIHHTVFKDFSQARNHALDCARQSLLDFDFLLLMDADMELQSHASQALMGFNAPAALLIQDNGKITYPNVRLLHRRAKASYTGPTHEVLLVDGETVLLHGWTFADHADGGSRPDKYERDERLLRQHLRQEPDNTRSLFYLAQTLRDKGEPAAAIEVYQKRMAAGGWDEEVWYAAYQIAACHQRLGQLAEMTHACLAAYNLRPTRAEPLMLLAKQQAQNGLHDAALLILEQVQHMERPVSDLLFVEHHAYGDAVRELISISGYHSALPHRRAHGQQVCEALALDHGADFLLREQARQNLFFYARSWQDLAPDTQCLRLDLPAGEPWALTNPSIVAHADGYCGIVRGVNYQLEQGRYTVRDPDGIVRTRNHWVEFDADLNVRDWHVMEDISSLPRRKECRIHGFEDCRPFFTQGQWWASATARDLYPDDRARLVLLRLNAKHHIDHAQALHGFGDQLHQKNWMPIPGERMRWLYSCSPAFVMEADPHTGRLHVESGEVPHLACEHWRGGGQLVPWDKGWLGIIHEARDTPHGRHYLHRWILTDAQGVIQHHSLPFYLIQPGIEFIAGLTWAHPDSQLLLSLGVNDCQAWLIKVSRSDVARSLGV